MANTNTNTDPNANIDPVLLDMSEGVTQNTTTENQQASQSAQPNKEEENSDVDPEILAMLEEAKQAFEEGLLEQAACDLGAELDDDALDREFELAFATLDEEEPGWDDPDYWDRSGANSPASVRSYGFGPIPDEYRNYDDDTRSVGSDNSLFREKIPPVGQRPILKPKTRVRATPAEKATAAMMPFTVSNPANIPAMTFPSNPSWSGDPIPSSGQQTLTFMGVTTSVPVLSDTTNMEMVNNMPTMTNAVQQCSNEKDRALVGLAMQELNAATHKAIAAGVREASMAADIRRLEEDRKSMNLRFADLEARLIEQIESTSWAHAEAQSRASKELEICRNALTASQQSCNAVNKENGDLKRQVSELASATNKLDKEGNEIRHHVTKLSNHVSFVNGELDTRTRERDFAVQKLEEAQSHINEAIAANNQQRQQIEIMESNAAAKETEVKNLVTALTKAESEKHAEVGKLMTALTKAESEKLAEVESLMTALTKAESEKLAEVENLMTALTKAESEKQDLERKAQEKDRDLVPTPESPAQLSTTEQHWKDKYDAADEMARIAQKDAEAYEQDYFDMQGQYKSASTNVAQLTDTVGELKAVVQRKESEIFELNKKITKLNSQLNEMATDTAILNNDHRKELDKLKKKCMVMENEKRYIDGLLNAANAEGNRLKAVVDRNKKDIRNLQGELSRRIEFNTELEEQLKEERQSSKDALRVARMANVHRAQHKQEIPRPPRDNNRYSIPTLDEQLAAWKEDDGSSAKFMEDYRRILKENPMTPYKPTSKPKEPSTAAVGPSAADTKTSGVGPHEETADNFDDSSVTAVEPSVSSTETAIKPGGNSDTEYEPSPYYNPDLGKSKNVSSGHSRRPKQEKEYIHVNIYKTVDRTTEHTIHQARNPIWTFLYVYVDLWTIFAHHYPGFHPANVANVAGELFAQRFPNFAAYFELFHPANIAGSLSSGIPPNVKDLTRMDTDPGTATANPTNVDGGSETKTPTTIADTTPQAEDHTITKVTHKLPPLWSNLLTGILLLLTLYLLYQSYHILDQRHIWLSANEITRSAVARFWGRETGLLAGYGQGPSNWYVSKRICFWLIQGSGYSYALPG
ncbi:hypothetical protein ACLOAV_004771 [Pseudogymnoascus australis]